jgi:hypothetical protein
MSTALATQRLLLRLPVAGDASAAAELLTDPEVMRDLYRCAARLMVRDLVFGGSDIERATLSVFVPDDATGIVCCDRDGNPVPVRNPTVDRTQYAECLWLHCSRTTVSLGLPRARDSTLDDSH